MALVYATEHGKNKLYPSDTSFSANGTLLFTEKMYKHHLSLVVTDITANFSLTIR